jgi:trans-aconitate methyltransferase
MARVMVSPGWYVFLLEVKVMPERAVVEDMAAVIFSNAASVVQIGCGGGKKTHLKDNDFC